jgi:putative tricarboxylic transport membrane protein
VTRPISAGLLLVAALALLAMLIPTIRKVRKEAFKE